MIIKKKICLLGSYGVGKTSLIRRFVHNKFEEKYLSTLGVHISKKSLKITSAADINIEIELFIWDVANIEKFDSVIKNYLRGAHGAIVVIDLSRPNSSENIREFIKEFDDLNSNAPVTFVGNKIDLVDIEELKKNRLVQLEKDLERTILLTSAKTGENVEEIFIDIANQLIQKHD